MKYRFLIILLVGEAVLMLTVRPSFAQNHPGFEEFCRTQYLKSGECPKDICVLSCFDQAAENCVQSCVPLPCTKIVAADCPKEFCALMKDCAGNNICNYPMAGGKPKCGDLAYGGQDIKCCAGLIRRCGIEFLDATCDMEGYNSVYNIPICIPCGDGKCTQFENRCNCPEDCGGEPYQGAKFDAEANPKIDVKDVKADTPASVDKSSAK